MVILHKYLSIWRNILWIPDSKKEVLPKSVSVLLHECSTGKKTYRLMLTKYASNMTAIET